ncbi:hypothetical protein G6F43_004513 [Rhizopus delemar]|nr:hypothetical protein G6F43_004513 [Rhizopus delemar]
MDEESRQPSVRCASYNISSSTLSNPSSRPIEDDKGESSNTAVQKGNGTDFRRRKNWPERILVEITSLLHVLSPYGNILYCSESTFELTGYRPHELVGRKLVEFLHVDDMDVFIKDFQMSFHTRSPVMTYYRFRKKDETYVLFEVVGQPSAGEHPEAFYGVAQPVPTKSGALLDTFLELKAENEWLKKRIDEFSAKYGPVSIKYAENETQQQLESNTLSGPSFISNNQKGSRNIPEDSASWVDNKVEMEDVVYNNAEDTYGSGEQSDRKDKWKRRKKNKGVDEYVCKDCGTTSSPEWRKGPQGPKTLCNACGLRWAKKNKKKGSNEDQ